MTKLYLIRHGATKQNESRPLVLQGNRIDGPLSQTGAQQAARVAGILSNVRLSRVYSSPLRRARQTAESIAKPHALPVETVRPIHEVDVGNWEGLAWSQIMEDDPDRYARFMADPGGVPYLGGESYGDVLRRAKPAMLELLKRHDGESIAVVAHNVVNRVLLADLLGPAAHIRQGHSPVQLLYQPHSFQERRCRASDHERRVGAVSRGHAGRPSVAGLICRFGLSPTRFVDLLILGMRTDQYRVFLRESSV